MGALGQTSTGAIDLTAARANAAAGYPGFDAKAMNEFYGYPTTDYIAQAGGLDPSLYQVFSASEPPAPGSVPSPGGAGSSWIAPVMIGLIALIVIPNFFASR